jgi:hypothetical protein
VEDALGYLREEGGGVIEGFKRDLGYSEMVPYQCYPTSVVEALLIIKRSEQGKRGGSTIFPQVMETPTPLRELRARRHGNGRREIVETGLGGDLFDRAQQSGL